MSQVNLSEETFKLAERRAAQEGFQSVDEYIEEIVAQNVNDENEVPDGFFTPERIAMLERISLEIKAGGKTYSLEEVDQQLAKVREEWLQSHKG